MDSLQAEEILEKFSQANWFRRNILPVSRKRLETAVKVLAPIAGAHECRIIREAAIKGLAHQISADTLADTFRRLCANGQKEARPTLWALAEYGGVDKLHEAGQLNSVVSNLGTRVRANDLDWHAVRALLINDAGKDLSSDVLVDVVRRAAQYGSPESILCARAGMTTVLEKSLGFKVESDFKLTGFHLNVPDSTSKGELVLIHDGANYVGGQNPFTSIEAQVRKHGLPGRPDVPNTPQFQTAHKQALYALASSVAPGHSGAPSDTMTFGMAQ